MTRHLHYEVIKEYPLPHSMDRVAYGRWEAYGDVIAKALGCKKEHMLIEHREEDDYWALYVYDERGNPLRVMSYTCALEYVLDAYLRGEL